MEQTRWGERHDMQVRPEIIALVVLAGCSTAQTYRPVEAKAGTASPIHACTVEDRCALTGTVDGQRKPGNASWAILTQGKACIALLLPSEAYARWQSMNGKRVYVQGTALSRGASANGVTLLAYRDRWLSPTTCGVNDTILYVDRMEFAK